MGMKKNFSQKPIVESTVKLARQVPSLLYSFYTNSWGNATYWRIARSSGDCSTISLVDIAKDDVNRLQSLHVEQVGRTEE